MMYFFQCSSIIHPFSAPRSKKHMYVCVAQRYVLTLNMCSAPLHGGFSSGNKRKSNVRCIYKSHSCDIFAPHHTLCTGYQAHCLQTSSLNNSLENYVNIFLPKTCNPFYLARQYRRKFAERNLTNGRKERHRIIS